MKLKRLILCIILLLIPKVGWSQTTTQSLEYDYKATLPAVVSTYTQTVKINTATATIITPACALAGSDTHCVWPIPSPGVKSGDVITVTATGTNGLSTSSLPLTYNPGAPPTGASSLTIVITFKVP